MERCDSYHDGHTCDGASACRRALIAMCERMSNRVQNRTDERQPKITDTRSKA